MFNTFVEKLHASPCKFNLITTGAGGSAITALMGVAGCSRTLINAQVPYNTKVTKKILDHAPNKFASQVVGRQLAQHAYCEGIAMGESFATFCGVGATAAILTDRTRHGADVVFVTAWSRDLVTDYSYTMPSEWSRADQEQLVCTMILKSMADFANIQDDSVNLPEGVAVSALSLQSPINSVINGSCKYALFNHLGEVRMPMAPFTEECQDLNTIYLLYPGSFKPLHWGHTELARVAGEVMRRYHTPDTPVVITYEISASVVGKKDVCEEDFRERLEQFTSHSRRVVITSAKLFVEKAEMFPNHGLVVGIDTARRVLDPQFYDNSEEKMMQAMKCIDDRGCYFVVGGRKHGEDWDDLTCLVIPEPIRHMFKGINPADFRVDISSTEIRARRMSSMGADGSN
jgi:phosphopantetheine adenylyltransferase